MDLGVAGTIAIKEFKDGPLNKYHGGIDLVTAANRLSVWLENNPDLEIIDVKYARDRVLAIYRKEGMKCHKF